MNTFSIVDTLDTACWEQFVEAHPKGSIFHTPAMFQVYQNTKNYHPLLLAAVNPSGQVLALLVAVRIQTLLDPFGNLSSRSIFYAEPLCREDETSIAALTALIAEHDARVRNRVLFTEVRPLYAPGAEKTSLERNGYKYEEYLNFLVDLTQSQDQLWNNLKKKTRSDIQRSQKRGIIAKDVTAESNVDIVYPVIQASFKRAKVPLADKSLFVEAFKTLQPRNMLKVSTVTFQDTIVSASVDLLYKKKMYDWFLGVKRMSGLYPADCLTWHEFEYGQQHGFEVYDFGGAGWPNKPYGVRDFKAKFGGTLVNYGRYRKIYSPLKFTLAEKGYDFARNVVNPLRWQNTQSKEPD